MDGNCKSDCPINDSESTFLTAIALSDHLHLAFPRYELMKYLTNHNS